MSIQLPQRLEWLLANANSFAWTASDNRDRVEELRAYLIHMQAIVDAARRWAVSHAADADGRSWPGPASSVAGIVNAIAALDAGETP